MSQTFVIELIRLGGGEVLGANMMGGGEVPSGPATSLKYKHCLLLPSSERGFWGRRVKGDNEISWNTIFIEIGVLIPPNLRVVGSILSD